MWGMFYRENVDYPKLIWEDFAYQIDHRKERKSRRENMPFPRFTKVIINHFLKQYKSISNLKYQHYHTIKDGDIVSKLGFVRIGEDYQEYGLVIPDVMLNDAIKQSESYQMFIKYSPDEIPPKKSRGKESEPEPQLVKKKTASRRVVKKKVTISAADNIIPDPDVALELEQEAVDTMKDLKESKKTSRRQPGTGGSSEGTGTILRVPDESTVISATLSEGTESEYSEEDQLDDEEKNDKDGDADDEGDDHSSDTQDTDDEDAKTESDEDEIYKYKIRMRKDVDVEMAEPETIKHENKEKDVMTDANKLDVEKSTEDKGDAKNVKNVAGSNYQVKESTLLSFSLLISILVNGRPDRLNSVDSVSLSSSESQSSIIGGPKLLDLTLELWVMFL
ncbi:hypothetical protein Tco_0525157 [Tanacetum coccineum]